MAGTGIIGEIGIGDLNTNRLARQVYKTISLLNKRGHPLLALSAFADKKTYAVNSRKVEFQKDVVHPESVIVLTAYLAGATSIVLAAGGCDSVQVGALLYNSERNEQMRVTAKNTATDTITVSRDWPAGGAGSAGSVGDHLMILPAVWGDKSVAPSGEFVDTTWDYQYLPVFMKTLDVSKLVEKDTTYGGSVRNHNTKKLWLEFNKEREMARLFGVAGALVDPIEGRMLSANGLNTIISSNIHDNAGASLTESIMSGWIVNDCMYTTDDSGSGSSTKTLLVSPSMFSIIRSWGLAAVRTSTSDKKWGFIPYSWLSPSGEIEIIIHELLSGFGNGKVGYLIDTGDIRTPVQVSARLMKDVQNPQNIQALMDVYYAVEAIEIHEEKLHAKYTNFTA